MRSAAFQLVPAGRHEKLVGAKTLTKCIQFSGQQGYLVKKQALKYQYVHFASSTNSHQVDYYSNEIKLKRNVRYSKHHERNVMDIYEPSEIEPTKINPTPVFLFFHGGMWMRGSKEDSPIKSNWDLATSALNYCLGYNDSNNHDSDRKDASDSTKEGWKYSNVGQTIASQGGRAYIPTYRLLIDPTSEEELGSSGEATHPHQVMDVARAIVHVMDIELQKRNKSSKQQVRSVTNSDYSKKHPPDVPHIYIGGHSAGAHLTALVLSDPKYLHLALMERGMIDSTTTNSLHDYSLSSLNQFLQCHNILAGFIGISGPYNIARLNQSALADVTIGPAFLGKGLGMQSTSIKSDTKQKRPNDNSIIRQASPIHVLLQCFSKMKQNEKKEYTEPSMKSIDSNQESRQSLPPLVQVPVLLLNAESDFHLHQDSKELALALDQFSSLRRTSINLLQQSKHRIIQETIKDRNHLSIMWEFGNGFLDEIILHEENGQEQHQSKDEPLTRQGMQGGNENNENLSTTLYEQINEYVSIDSIIDYVSGEKGKDPTASRILDFMSLK